MRWWVYSFTRYCLWLTPGTGRRLALAKYKPRIWFWVLTEKKKNRCHSRLNCFSVSSLIAAEWLIGFCLRIGWDVFSLSCPHYSLWFQECLCLLSGNEELGMVGRSQELNFPFLPLSAFSISPPRPFVSRFLSWDRHGKSAAQSEASWGELLSKRLTHFLKVKLLDVL